MRILATIAGLLLCSLSFAQGIPSASSGVYLTPDRVCRVVFQRYQVSWIRADLTCLEFGGMLSNSAQTVYAPEAGSCWPDGSAIPFNPQSPVDYVTFRSASANALAVQVGTQGAVVNGVGTNQAWQLIAPVVSPAPYTCGASLPVLNPHYARHCRNLGIYCGG